MDLDFDKYKEIQFCDNKGCPFYGLVGEGNIKIASRADRRVYCNHCKNRWPITKNTFFYNLRTPIKDVLESLLLLSEGTGLRATARIKNVTTDVLQEWIVKAANHVNELNVHFRAGMNLTQCQIDEFWSFIRKKKGDYQKKKKN